jgi:hypothetical protein
VKTAKTREFSRVTCLHDVSVIKGQDKFKFPRPIFTTCGMAISGRYRKMFERTLHVMFQH